MSKSMCKKATPVSWMHPVWITRPSANENVIIPGTSRPAYPLSTATRASRKSGSVIPTTPTNALTSASVIVRDDVRNRKPTGISCHVRPRRSGGVSSKVTRSIVYDLPVRGSKRIGKLIYRNGLTPAIG